MKIKLEKDWRAYGQLNKAGTILNVKNADTLKFLKENGYIYKKEKKEKKSKVKIAKENN
tara:strand:+ start:1532 stop:1708 length:177 start_codon:yes stop_codon:yes gene_type:complete